MKLVKEEPEQQGKDVGLAVARASNKYINYNLSVYIEEERFLFQFILRFISRFKWYKWIEAQRKERRSPFASENRKESLVE